MKKIYSLFAALCAATLLFSCENAAKDVPTNPDEPITNGGGVLKFVIESDSPWAISRSLNSESFIKVTPSSGSAGLTEVVIEVAPRSDSYTEKIDFKNDRYCLVANNALGSGAYLIQPNNISKSFYANGFVNSAGMGAMIKMLISDTQRTPMTSVNVSNCPKLTNLDFLRNGFSYDATLSKIESIDISNTQIQYITRGEMNSFQPPLIGLKIFRAVNSQQFNKFDFSKSTELTTVIISNSKLTTLDFSNSPKLETLEITNNSQLTEVFLKQGQTIKNLKKDPQTVIKYK